VAAAIAKPRDTQRLEYAPWSTLTSFASFRGVHQGRREENGI